MSAPSDIRHTLGDKPVEPQYVEAMNKVARSIDLMFNPLAPAGVERTTGFVLLVFPFGTADGGRCNFISNGADRKDLAALFREMAARFEGMPEVNGGRA